MRFHDMAEVPDRPSEDRGPILIESFLERRQCFGILARKAHGELPGAWIGLPPGAFQHRILLHPLVIRYAVRHVLERRFRQVLLVTAMWLNLPHTVRPQNGAERDLGAVRSIYTYVVPLFNSSFGVSSLANRLFT